MKNTDFLKEKINNDYPTKKDLAGPISPISPCSV